MRGCTAAVRILRFFHVPCQCVDFLNLSSVQKNTSRENQHDKNTF